MNHFTNQLKASYGCKFMPPWLNVTCEESDNIDLTDLDADHLDQSWYDIDRLTDGITIKAMQQCKPPCKR